MVENCLSLGVDYYRKLTPPPHHHHTHAQDWFQNRVLEFRSGVADVSLWLMLPSWAFLNIFRKLLPPLYPLIMCDFVIQIFLVEKYGARVGAGVFQLLALSDIITFIILRLVYKKFTPCVDSFFDAKQPTKWWQSDEVRSTLLWLDTLWWNRMERYSWLMRCIFVVGFGTTYWSYPYAALLWLAMRSQIHVVAYAIGLVLALCADYFRMVCRLHLFDMFGKVSLESSILFPVILYKKEPLFVLGVTIMTSSVAFLWVHGFTGVACLVRIARWCQPRCSKVMGSEACCCLTVVKEAFPSIWGSRLQRRGEGRWGFGLPDHPLGVLDGGNVDDEEMMVERRFTVPRLVVEEDVDHDVAVAASDEEDLRSITVMSGSSAAGGAARAEAAKAEVVGNEQGHSRMNSFSTDEMSSNENEGGGMPRSSSRSSLLLNSSPLYREDESPRGTGRKKRGNAKGRFPSTNGWCSPGLTGSTATLAPPLPPPSSPRDAADAAAVDASASVKATGKGGGGESSTAAVGGEEKSEIDVLKAHGLFMSF